MVVRQSLQGVTLAGARMKISKAHNTFANMPLCGAKAKSTGKPCRCGAMSNGRCHKHGGASKGRPITTGQWTKEAIQRRKDIRQLLQRMKSIIDES